MLLLLFGQEIYFVNVLKKSTHSSTLTYFYLTNKKAKKASLLWFLHTFLQCFQRSTEPRCKSKWYISFNTSWWHCDTELITEYSEIEVVLGVKVKLWTSGTHQNSEQLPFKRTHLYILPKRLFAFFQLGRKTQGMAIAEAMTSASGRCWKMKMFYCYSIFNLCYVAHFKCFGILRSFWKASVWSWLNAIVTTNVSWLQATGLLQHSQHYHLYAFSLLTWLLSMFWFCANDSVAAIPTLCSI